VSIYVRRVVGNLKGGCDLEIGPRTLITGPNGSGKSRIVNTLELALSGFASDIVGRSELRQGADLIALAPEGDNLYAEVTLSDDKTMGVYRVERKKKGKTGRPNHAPPQNLTVVYPIRDVLTALRGTVGAARSFVLRNSGLDVTDDAIIERLPATYRDLYRTYAAAHDNAPTAVERLLTIRDDASASSRSAVAGAKAHTTILNAFGADMPALRPTEEEVEAAQLAAREAATLYNEAVRVPDVLDATTLRTAAAAAIETLREWEAKVTQLRAKVTQLRATPGNGGAANVVELRTALVTLLEAHAAHATGAGTEDCLMCGHEMKIDPARLRDRASAIRGTLLNAQEAISAQRQLGHAEHALETAQRSAEEAVATYQAANASSSDDERQAGDQRQAVVATAYATLTDAEGKVLRLTEAQVTWEKVQQARDLLADAEREAVDSKALANACVEVIDALTLDGCSQFVMSVNEFLPEGDEFDLVLQSGSREVCAFGFRRDGMLHTALSGAEWARLTLALGAATLPTGDNVLAVLTPEERAYDGKTLSSVMRALAEAPGQVLITSPVKPRGRTPKGWTVIDVEEMGAARAAEPEPSPKKSKKATEAPSETPTNGGDIAAFLSDPQPKAEA